MFLIPLMGSSHKQTRIINRESDTPFHVYRASWHQCQLRTLLKYFLPSTKPGFLPSTKSIKKSTVVIMCFLSVVNKKKIELIFSILSFRWHGITGWCEKNCSFLKTFFYWPNWLNLKKRLIKMTWDQYTKHYTNPFPDCMLQKRKIYHRPVTQPIREETLQLHWQTDSEEGITISGIHIQSERECARWVICMWLLLPESSFQRMFQTSIQ